MDFESEVKILELEERNKFLQQEYNWIFNEYKRLRQILDRSINGN